MTKAEMGQIEAAKAAFVKATPGPWIVEGMGVVQKRDDISSDQRDIAYLNIEAGDIDQFGSAVAAENNGIIIAASHALLRRVIELEAWQQEALEWLYELRSEYEYGAKHWDREEGKGRYNTELDDLNALILGAQIQGYPL